MSVRINRQGVSALTLATEIVRLHRKLPEKYAKAAVKLYAQIAPRSNVSEPGYTHMADSMEAKKISAGVWEVQVKKDYARLVEYGTIYMDAQPAFVPTISSMWRAMRKDAQLAFLLKQSIALARALRKAA